MTTNVIAATAALLLVSAPGPAWANGRSSMEGGGAPDVERAGTSGHDQRIVLSGAYRCVRPEEEHTLSFTSSDLNPVNIATRLGNLDAGDCFIIANLLQQAARQAGCTTNPAIPLVPQDGAMLDMICTGSHDALVGLIARLGVIALTYQQPQP